MAKKAKVPGRKKLTCATPNCGTKFSTNRTVCHKCAPKCTECHCFPKK